MLYKIIARHTLTLLESEVNAVVGSGTGWETAGGLVILPADLARVDSTQIASPPRFMRAVCRNPDWSGHG